jgi:enhanced entry protein EnhC
MESTPVLHSENITLQREVEKFLPSYSLNYRHEIILSILENGPGLMDIVGAHESWNQQASLILVNMLECGNQPWSSSWHEKEQYQKIYGIYKCLADQWNRLAKTWMAFDCFDKKIEKNYEIAFKWILEAAEEWDPDAEYELAQIYENGNFGIQQDYEIAFKWLIKAQENNHISIEDHIRSDISTFEYYQYIAEQGNLYALRKLWMMCLYGSWIERNIEKALNYFMRGSDQGDNRAMEHLSHVYARTSYGYQDFQKAAHYLGMAASHGNKNAITKLWG